MFLTKSFTIDTVDFSVSKKSPPKTNRQLDESLFMNKASSDSSLKRTSSILEDEDELLYSEDDEEEENMKLNNKKQEAENETNKTGILFFNSFLAVKRTVVFNSKNPSKFYSCL